MRTRYPIHRSLVLWGGMLVMAFTVWAWMDSRGKDSYVRWQGYSAGNVQNGIALLSNMTFGTSEVEWRRNEAAKVFPADVTPLPFLLRGTSHEVGMPTEDLIKPDTLEKFIRGVMTMRTPDALCLFIPHWLILLVTAAVMVAWLVWRARRWKRVQEVGSTIDGVG